MTGTIELTEVEWDAALTELAHVTGRLGRLLRTASIPTTGAVVGHWSAIEAAAHVTHAYEALAGMVAGWEPPLRDVWELSDLTERLLTEDPERDPAVLADRVELAGSRFLELVTAARRHDAGGTRPWLVAGVDAPLSMVTCHLLNEAVVHGWDVAQAAGADWTITPRQATLILKGFVFALMARLEPSTMVDPARGRDVDVRYDLRLRGGPRLALAIEDGRLRLGGQTDRVDCRLSMEPVAFLLVAWNRQSQWGHIARGNFLTWGRRPWMALRLRSLLRNT